MMQAKDSSRTGFHSKRERKTTTSEKEINNTEVTHTDFINFLAPFFEPPDEKKFNDLVTVLPSQKQEKSLEFYKRYGSILKDRLCCCYVLNNDGEIDCNTHFEKELSFRSQASSKNDFASFFVKNNILDDFKNIKLLSVEQEYEDQVRKNIMNRQIIGEALKERVKITGYFQAHEMIHKELENVYNKVRSKKKKMKLDLDDETVEEYLKRIDEFVVTFGDCNQFEDGCTTYPDILTDGQDGGIIDDFVYLP